MPETKDLVVDQIDLDLKNYRTVPQKTEKDAINAMIAIKPERFYAIIESILENDYLPTENIIILSNGRNIVKEGNRRIAALKLILGIHNIDDFNLPNHLQKEIGGIDDNWKNKNNHVPCSIFSISEKGLVDKIVNLTHAKGEKASRDPWSSVAKARQNRNEKKAIEPTLDLLEKYLEYGQNLTNQQKERWSGDYPLTVLEEAFRTTTKRLGYNTISELASAYPKITYRHQIEEIIRDIGLEKFGFKIIRDTKSDFLAPYGIPLRPQIETPNPDHNKTVEKQRFSDKNTSLDTPVDIKKDSKAAPVNLSSSSSPNEIKSALPGKKKQKTKAYNIYDQRTINKTLKKFNPKGNNRQKLVTLRDELKKLKVKDNPIAFCFLLRSMFEISAVIYCEENSIPTYEIKKSNNRQNKTLKQLLEAVTKNLTSGDSKVDMKKTLHGANSELSKPAGLLSVTSMNQLVHDPSFSIAPHDICVIFNNVYPLLEAMN